MEEKILSILKAQKEFVSGEMLSKDAGVSRTAIWKHINKLREKGYAIESITNKGYRLLSSPDILSYSEIEPFLHTKFVCRKVLYEQILPSTNDYARELLYKDSSNGTVIIAENQQNGRGKKGNRWISDMKKGIWMSLILMPQKKVSFVHQIHCMACTAIIKSLREYQIEADFKAPNDIYLHGKKLGGILTELYGELWNVEYVVLGIGINCYQQNFEKELEDKATSLFREGILNFSRKEIIASFANHFEELYKMSCSKTSCHDKMYEEIQNKYQDSLKDMEEKG